ncbi:MAG: hypothetical protein JSV84_12640 [Gemmatimonadota bacterium]|nr:MAG: hypothetical protein JSV84_12640 [Gemmatimonadota bacterium]
MICGKRKDSVTAREAVLQAAGESSFIPERGRLLRGACPGYSTGARNDRQGVTIVREAVLYATGQFFKNCPMRELFGRDICFFMLRSVKNGGRYFDQRHEAGVQGGMVR